MKKFKSYKVLCVTLGLGIAFSGTVLNASTLTKSLKAIYNNIAISYNGQTKFLSSEPFIVNGVTYVPLRAVGEIMGSSVSWANNTVYITSSTLPSTSAEQEISAKNFEIASLKQQLVIAQEELKTLKGTNSDGTVITTAALDVTLSKIRDTYYDEFDMDWDFALKLVSGRLELTVSYDSRYDDTKYDRTSESKREQFIEDICYDIAAAHKNIEIRGILKDTRTSTEKATYKYSKTGSFQYDEVSTLSLTDLRKELEYDYKSIRLGTFDLTIATIDLVERNDELTFTLTTNLRPGTYDYRANWNDITSSDERTLESLFDNIIYDIEREYTSSNNIVGVIKDSNSGDLIADYENDRLRVHSVTE